MLYISPSTELASGKRICYIKKMADKKRPGRKPFGFVMELKMPGDMKEAVDAVRSAIPRAVWIRQAIAEKLKRDQRKRGPVKPT